MKKDSISGQLSVGRESVRLEGTYRGKYRVFAAFVICCGLLLAAFAVSAVWMQGGKDEGFLGLGSFWKDQEENTADGKEETTTEEFANSEPTDPSEIPQGATSIVTMDLSALSLGSSYIHNETPYRPSAEELMKLDSSASAVSDQPLVLILHTHTSEAYLPSGTAYIEGNVGDAVYSREETQNVISVGQVLAQTLQQKGITAIHCTVMHDDPTLSGSYERAKKTVEEYLNRYPSIEYVIDLHRDSVSTKDGALVRAVADVRGSEVAQVMAVVGTDCNGTSHNRWQNNLSLALQLRAKLNQCAENICRPVSLRKASFHQELAKHALLLEIGTSANSVEEAKRAAALVGEALATLIYAR